MWAGFFSYGLTGHTEVLWAASFKQKFYISGFTGPFVDENFIVALTYCGEKLFLYYDFQWKNFCWSNFYTNCSLILDCILRWAKKELKLNEEFV